VNEAKKTGGMDKGSWLLMMLAFVFGVLLVMALCTPRRTTLKGGAMRIFGIVKVGEGRLAAVLEDGALALLRVDGSNLTVEAEYTIKRLQGRLLAERVGGQEAVLRAQQELFERFCGQGKLEAALDIARQLAAGGGMAYLQGQLEVQGSCGDVAALALAEKGVATAGPRLLKMLEANTMREKTLAALAAITGKTPPKDKDPLDFYRSLLGEKR